MTRSKSRIRRLKLREERRSEERRSSSTSIFVDKKGWVTGNEQEIVANIGWIEPVQEKEKVEFHVSIRNLDSSIHWYLITYQPNNKPGKEFNISRVDKLYQNRKALYTNYASVAHESMIYILGGTTPRERIGIRPKPRNNVLVYNTLSGKFKSHAPMKCARDFHLATVISSTGEIYVFGHNSYHCLTLNEWAEYYSPKTHKWMCLSPPPQEIKWWKFRPEGIAHHEPTKTIFLWQIYIGFLSYCYSDGSWNFRKTTQCPCSSSAAVVGNLLFWKSDDDEIYAYDLVRKTILLNAKDAKTYDPVSLEGCGLVHFGHYLWCQITCDSEDGELKLDKIQFPANPPSGKGKHGDGGLATLPSGGRTKQFYIGPEYYYIKHVHVLTRHYWKYYVAEDGWSETAIEAEGGVAGKEEPLEMEAVNEGDMQEAFMLIYMQGIESHLVGGIIRAFEKKGFKLKGLYLMVLSELFAQDYCWEIRSNDKYDFYMEYLMFSPSVAIIWEGIDAVTEVVKTIGPPGAPWIIDKDDYPVEIGRQMIDYCDSVESARKRISWFRKGPISGSDLGPLKTCDPEVQKRLMTNVELALIIIKPDYVVKGYVGEVIRIFEKKGFTLKGLKFSENSASRSSTSEGYVAIIWQGIDVYKHIEKTIYAKKTDIFASWIKVGKSLVKIDSNIVDLQEKEKIETYFTIKVMMEKGWNKENLELIFE